MSALFASYFFGFGLFLPFFPLVLEFRGLSAAEIGIVVGAGSFARIVSSPVFSSLADLTGQRRLSILFYCLIGAAFLALFIVPGNGSLLAVAVIGYMVFLAPVMPLSDAYALDAARTTGADYARMRLWGSASFVAATLIGGALAAEATSWIIILLIGASAVGTGAVVMSLPRRQAGEDGPAPDGASPVSAPFRRLWFWPVVLLLGLFQATHSAFYGFGTIYWQSINVPDFAIGALWAISVVTEIALFTVAGRLAQKFDPAVFLLAAGIACTLRWGLFPLAETLVFIALLQALHGLTFGAAHLGAVAVLARVVPSRWAGTGQGLFATSIGLQIAIWTAVSGVLYEKDPHLPFYLMAAISAVATASAIVMTPMLRRHMANAPADV